ncbi:ladderlectin-like [Centropristis striata]|uniref:ladderlectin-like n=1 Tax=Centropristis striata TaxID=184440 RepID=UPI0027E16BFB|nr:ladderlectin-like [Centropristis striata]
MLTVSLLVCAVIVLAGADDDAAAAPSCPELWSEFNGRCFNYVGTERSWTDAEKNCQSMKGNLASVHNDEEFGFLQGMMAEDNSTNPDIWIGGSNCQQDKTWLWSNGQVFFYSNWCDGKPDNEGGSQHCLGMNSTDGSCWNDLDCSSKLPSVCAVSL